ncbi:MAG: aminodeoxychorismate synthase component I [Proteobacteria bacterium]|nr:aminodeoxychorismate synthase component I [Pseudomonadota bacterium]
MLPEFPLVEEFPYCCPVSVFAAIPQQGALFLDSARVDENGRYSFIGVSPFEIMLCKNATVNPFDALEQKLKQYPLSCLPDLPPFQGGVAGMFGYELGGYLEKIPQSTIDDLQLPELLVGFYDLVLAWDNKQKRAWVFSSGYPEQESAKRRERAEQRISWVLGYLSQPLAQIPNFAIDDSEITSTFNQQSYEAAVSKVIEYIRAGDIFEANISQRFSCPRPQVDPFALYRKLRAKNPAPFAAYLQYNDWVVASASPERFLKLSDGYVEARPIKGTRPRSQDPLIDKANGEALLKSEKDWAENVMIVDLMRNDISRVCKPNTIHVPQLCGLESFATVHHLVSVVEGQLQENKTAIDLLKATFPGGSITGAPKIRTMEIIAEIEPTVRGPYCGSMGYIGFNGDMDLSITIRTFVMNKEKLTFQTGGAVTVDSDPSEEYEETLTKAKALRKTLVEL